MANMQHELGSWAEVQAFLGAETMAALRSSVAAAPRFDEQMRAELAVILQRPPRGPGNDARASEAA